LTRLAGKSKGGRRLAEAQAMSQVARAILHSALARTESRGAHSRNDFSHRNDQSFQKHSVYTVRAPVTFKTW
jgi:succinate dehydrogenase/fumarate reductase flavoprotein subunit